MLKILFLKNIVINNIIFKRKNIKNNFFWWCKNLYNNIYHVEHLADNHQY